MHNPITPRLRAAMFTALLGTTPYSHAAVLAAFDFDDDNGEFELQPEQLDAAIDSTLFSVTSGTLTDFAGNPGRALAASAFTTENRIRLELLPHAGQRITVDTVTFDMRVSGTGPQQWRVELNGITLGLGATSTAFSSFELVPEIELAPFTSDLHLDFYATGAASAQGTLRLDNVVISGTPSAVPLPPAVALLTVPLLGTLTSRSRRRRGPLTPRIE